MEEAARTPSLQFQIHIYQEMPQSLHSVVFLIGCTAHSRANLFPCQQVLSPLFMEGDLEASANVNISYT